MPTNNGVKSTSLVVNDGEGMSCECPCKQAKDDVFCLTIGDTMIFMSLACLVEAATSAIDEGKMTTLV